MQHNFRHTSSVLLHIYDGLPNTRFLINTGAAVSDLPARDGERCPTPVLHFYTVNSTRIPVYLRRKPKLDLSLRQSFKWTFYVGAVSQAIIGADFLQYFNLMIDVRGQRLMDPLTELSTSAKTTSDLSTLLSAINPEH